MGSFRFKQFEVVQDFSAMKVNTDAVLLGAWMSVPQCETARVLDIGTGTGVIALMAGQRLSENGVAAHIDAVEIDVDACKDASANFDAAPWKGVSFELHNVPLQEYAGNAGGACESGGYDLIFSNPPYFISSLKNDSQAKTTARHTDTLSQRELLFYSTPLLKEGGTLAIILPVVEGEELLRKVEFMANAAAVAANATVAASGGCRSTCSGDNSDTISNSAPGQLALFPSRICYVHTVERKPAKRLMLEFVKCTPSNRPTMHREQLVMMSGGANTPEYAELVGGFYLR